MSLRLAAAACSGLVVACLWSAPSSVHLHGKVLLTVCSGTQPKDPPPNWSPCGTRAVDGATVLLAPMQGLVMRVQSDSSGTYQVDVTPGSYMIAAVIHKQVSVWSEPRWLVIPVQPSMSWDVSAQLNMV